MSAMETNFLAVDILELSHTDPVTASVNRWKLGKEDQHAPFPPPYLLALLRPIKASREYGMWRYLIELRET